MKTLFKWAFRLFLLLIVLIVAGILLMDTAIKAVVVSRFKERTGMDIKIGKLTVGLWNPHFAVEDVVLYNTPEFGGGRMLDLKELRVDYDRRALREHKLHFYLIRLDLNELTIVKNLDGKTNFEELKKFSPKAKDKEADKDKPERDYPVIDTLSLSLGKVKTVDMRQPENVRTVELNIHDEVLTGIVDRQSAEGKFGPLALRVGAPFIYEGLFPTPDHIKPKRPREKEVTANRATNAVAPAATATARQ